MLRKRFKKLLEDSPPPKDEKSSTEDIKIKESNINPYLETTLEIFKSIYSFPNNQDVKIRNLHIPGLMKNGAILYIDTITDPTVIEEHIIKPLLTNENNSSEISEIVTAQTITLKKVINEALIDINKGNVALFIEGESNVFLIGASKFEGRNVEKAENETVVKGPKEAFNEKAVTNISLIRKKI